MRTLISAFAKGQSGNHYLVADVEKVEGLTDMGVHGSRIPAFVLRQMLTSKGLEPYNIGNNNITTNVTTVLSRSIGQSRSPYHTTTDVLA